jgi:hypothetical protein
MLWMNIRPMAFRMMLKRVLVVSVNGNGYQKYRYGYS